MLPRKCAYFSRPLDFFPYAFTYPSTQTLVALRRSAQVPRASPARDMCVKPHDEHTSNHKAELHNKLVFTWNAIARFFPLFTPDMYDAVMLLPVKRGVVWTPSAPPGYASAYRLAVICPNHSQLISNTIGDWSHHISGSISTHSALDQGPGKD